MCCGKRALLRNLQQHLGTDGIFWGNFTRFLYGCDMWPLAVREEHDIQMYEIECSGKWRKEV